MYGTSKQKKTTNKQCFCECEPFAFVFYDKTAHRPGFKIVKLPLKTPMPGLKIVKLPLKTPIHICNYLTTKKNSANPN